MDTDAAKHATKLPPRSLVGRWGNIDTVEKFVFGAPETSVRQVLKAVAEEGKQRKRKRRKRTNDDIDNHLNEQETEYTQKMSQECFSVVTSTQDQVLWTLGMISQLSRQPWEHFFNWLKKKSNEFHKYNLGGVQAGLEESEPAAVADLVCHKAAEIQNEFVQLLNGDKWIDVLHRLDTSDIKKQSLVVSAIINAIIRNACTFEVRIVQVHKEYPFKLFALLRQPASTACDERKSQAKHLLENFATLETNTQKIVRILWPHLRTTSETGALTPECYNVLRMLATMVSGDTQEIEGINNIAKMIVRNSPTVALSLVSARTVLRKLLGLGRKESKRKWSAIAERYQNLVNVAHDNFAEHTQVLADHNRFASSPAKPFTRTFRQPQSRKSTARACTLRWYWLEGQTSKGNSISVLTWDHGRTFERAWLHAWSYNLEGYMLRCRVTTRTEQGLGPMIFIDKPFVRILNSEQDLGSKHTHTHTHTHARTHTRKCSIHPPLEQTHLCCQVRLLVYRTI